MTMPHPETNPESYPQPGYPAQAAPQYQQPAQAQVQAQPGYPQHQAQQQAQYSESAQIPAAPSPAALALLAVRAEVAKAVVGQDDTVTGLLIALLAGGHVLLEGVPGVAKTLLVRTLSTALSLDTKRVQFTPDLMPGDVTGSLIYDSSTSAFTFREGPVFTNILLADEINRTPPKTQASLLEAMEEHQVSVDGISRKLPAPFMVAATQNPVEYEGTYPLPEAQLDRFLLKLTMDLPGRDDEIEVIRRHSLGFDPQDLHAAGVRPVAGASELEQAREEVAQVTVAGEILAYVVDLVRATRTAPSFQLGVSPRGATAILKSARAYAWLSGRAFVTPDDIKALALPTLRHRVALRPEAEMDGVAVDGILLSILATVPVPR
ncbi:MULTISPECIES: AAA family ATPase [Arthrobacter]|uniref:AAA family ATPase n=1 Tax=Arthrobacter TaxID=1663 RepID=UPI001791B9B5|nr:MULTISPECIES: MoxR family ATPase [Arthrobacter]NYG18369.1 MoxR-like ATPase [Arthrobacter psychrochitiniphilus]